MRVSCASAAFASLAWRTTARRRRCTACTASTCWRRRRTRCFPDWVCEARLSGVAFPSRPGHASHLATKRATPGIGSARVGAAAGRVHGAAAVAAGLLRGHALAAAADARQPAAEAGAFAIRAGRAHLAEGRAQPDARAVFGARGRTRPRDGGVLRRGGAAALRPRLGLHVGVGHLGLLGRGRFLDGLERLLRCSGCLGRLLLRGGRLRRHRLRSRFRRLRLVRRQLRVRGLDRGVLRCIRVLWDAELVLQTRGRRLVAFINHAHPAGHLRARCRRAGGRREELGAVCTTHAPVRCLPAARCGNAPSSVRRLPAMASDIIGAGAGAGAVAIARMGMPTMRCFFFASAACGAATHSASSSRIASGRRTGAMVDASRQRAGGGQCVWQQQWSRRGTHGHGHGHGQRALQEWRHRTPDGTHQPSTRADES